MPLLIFLTIGLQRSEIALNANVERNGVLILELVNCVRLRRKSGEERGTSELLVEVEPLDFSRERQVLDGGPTGHEAQLIDVEVRVTRVVRRLAEVSSRTGITTSSGREGERRAKQELCSVVIPHRRCAAEQARRPVWIPVVVVRAAET